MTSDSKKEKGRKDQLAETLSRLQAQKLLALQNGQTKVAANIEKIILLLTNKKK